MSTVLLPQISFEVKLAIKSHRQIITILVSWEDRIKDNCVYFDVVYSKIWVEECGWTAIEGRLDSLYFAPVAYSQIASTINWFNSSFTFIGFYSPKFNLEIIIW